jgi:hypothetical protein
VPRSWAAAEVLRRRKWVEGGRGQRGQKDYVEEEVGWRRWKREKSLTRGYGRGEERGREGKRGEVDEQSFR